MSKMEIVKYIWAESPRAACSNERQILKRTPALPRTGSRRRLHRRFPWWRGAEDFVRYATQATTADVANSIPRKLRLPFTRCSSKMALQVAHRNQEWPIALDANWHQPQTNVAAKNSQRDAIFHRILEIVSQQRCSFIQRLRVVRIRLFQSSECQPPCSFLNCKQ